MSVTEVAYGALFSRLAFGCFKLHRAKVVHVTPWLAALFPEAFNTLLIDDAKLSLEKGTEERQWQQVYHDDKRVKLVGRLILLCTQYHAYRELVAVKDSLVARTAREKRAEAFKKDRDAQMWYQASHLLNFEDWGFHVVCNDSSRRCVVTLNRQVFITTGLLKNLPNNDELAVILGHEIAHVLSLDHAKDDSLLHFELPCLALLGFAFEGTCALWSALGVSVIFHLTKMKLSRVHELRMDRMGLHLAKLSGFDPVKGANVMLKSRSYPEEWWGHLYHCSLSGYPIGSKRHRELLLVAEEQPEKTLEALLRLAPVYVSHGWPGDET
jgi:Zn-dependent protease with chaperone function